MSVKKTDKKNIKKVVAKSSVAKPVITKVSPVKVAPSVIKKIEPKKLIKPLIFLLILALVYLFKDEVIVASVNGRPVTRWALIQNLEKQGGSTALENMTLKMLVEQELKKAGVVVSKEEMDAEITKIEEQLTAQGQNLDDLLKAQGLTRNEVRDQLSLSKGLEKLLADKITVSDDEVKAYFEANKVSIGADSKLEDVSESIKAQLKQQKLVSEQQKWFAEIKKTAKVNYFKFAPSTQL
jgi:foldase protein PrsA